jgi:hypothetical protein
MKDEHMLMYALVFVLGFMVSRMMSGRLIEGGETREPTEGETREPTEGETQVPNKYQLQHVLYHENAPEWLTDNVGIESCQGCRIVRQKELPVGNFRSSCAHDGVIPDTFGRVRICEGCEHFTSTVSGKSKCLPSG